MMKYSKTVRLKDGRTCMIRNGTQQDAQGVWDNFVLTHGETEFLTTYPEEVTFTLEQEEAYLKQKEESGRTRRCWRRSTERSSVRPA